ncbi:hypothetical protein PoB_001119000 [Plakobranchus ocellatus]|uniref:Uncharacterized protein n=1 Tax=Plakobranchus ocellatus TaxID=259542 RepID=A0AAV3YQI0_9GAST|nr:hypothetical protein PoB_001119000 [Plakobranchus ocellatus]
MQCVEVGGGTIQIDKNKEEEEEVNEGEGGPRDMALVSAAHEWSLKCLLLIRALGLFYQDRLAIGRFHARLHTECALPPLAAAIHQNDLV